MQRIQTIQALRAVAAWLVALGHISLSATVVSGGDEVFVAIRRFFALFFHAGVDVFFVISGAIMVLVTVRSSRSIGQDVTKFVAGRFFRIFPLFWITAVATLLVGASTLSPTWEHSVRSALLIRIPQEHPLGWTLVFEIRFYLAVLAIMILFKDRQRGFLLWVAAICALVFLTSEGVLPATYATMPLALEFAMGVVVGLLYTNGIRRLALPLLLVGLGWMLATIAFVAPNMSVEEFRVFGFGAPAALILYGLISMEADRRIKHLPAQIVAEGNASYSVYLWHVPVYKALVLVWPVGVLSAAIYAPVAIIAIWIVSRLSYAYLETPLINIGHKVAKAYPVFPPFTSTTKGPSVKTQEVL